MVLRAWRREVSIAKNTMPRGVLRTKSVAEILTQAGDPHFALKRTLGPLDVTLLGIGAIVGAGIFATMGTAAAGDVARPGAGPSLVLSFALTAVPCCFAALCYAELASMVPISGSAYTYAYVTLGELVAWIIGWDLIIEYAVGNVAVAISWANYFRTLCGNLGIGLPAWLATDYRTAERVPGLIASAPRVLGVPIVCNLLALGIVALLTVVLVRGIRESATLNAVMVVIKIAVLLFFVLAGLHFVAPGEMARNWHPFQPNGWSGTLAGAAVVFFAYIGFDAVSTVSEETRNPSRDMPIGILGSLLACTLLYVVVAAVFTGLVPYDELSRSLASEQAEPLTLALAHVAPHTAWPTTIVALGSVIAHTAVLLVFQLGQPRILFSMARDGLLPPPFGRVHPVFKTPHVSTILTGVAVGGVAAVASIDEMVDLTNVGTLFAFTVVCAAIPVLRLREPQRRRPFRVPLGPWLIPSLGIASCLGLMVYLPPASWWRFVGWLALGLSVYASYGYPNSALERPAGGPAAPSLPVRLAAVGFLLIAVALFTLPHAPTRGRVAGGLLAAGLVLLVPLGASSARRLLSPRP
jgi:APA family basic amino acid/polyamine antiporter